MLVGALAPFHDTGGDPDTVREYAQPHRDAKHQRYRESRFQQEDQRLSGTCVTNARRKLPVAVRRRDRICMRYHPR